jgi:hypothetical protein
MDRQNRRLVAADGEKAKKKGKKFVNAGGEKARTSVPKVAYVPR